jgi:hypothetical protein
MSNCEPTGPQPGSGPAHHTAKKKARNKVRYEPASRIVVTRPSKQTRDSVLEIRAQLTKLVQGCDAESDLFAEGTPLFCGRHFKI